MTQLRIHRLILRVYLSSTELPLMTRPCVLRKLCGDAQRNARHTSEHGIRKVSAQHVVRQGERK
jgi:hypothetical protein